MLNSVLEKQRRISLPHYSSLAYHHCYCCSEKATEIHHIKPISIGGSSNPENLVGLCKECHRKVTYNNYCVFCSGLARIRNTYSINGKNCCKACYVDLKHKTPHDIRRRKESNRRIRWLLVQKIPNIDGNNSVPNIKKHEIVQSLGGEH